MKYADEYVYSPRYKLQMIGSNIDGSNFVSKW